MRPPLHETNRRPNSRYFDEKSHFNGNCGEMNVVDGRVGQEELAMWDSEQLQGVPVHFRSHTDFTQPTAAGTLRPLAVIKMLGRQASRIGGRRPSAGTSTPVLTGNGRIRIRFCLSMCRL